MADYARAVGDPGACFATGPVHLTVSRTPIPYPIALEAMDRAVEAILDGTGPERLWFLEHPPLYTAGTTAKPADLKDADRFPVYPAKRGGQYTYHGPGQRVAYLMLDLRHRVRDVRKYVGDLERWLIASLGDFNIDGELRRGRVGVWVDRSRPGMPKEDKIAAIGVRIRRWVSLHGIALNVEPDLSHFSGITPCGISDAQYGVTSLVDLGRPVTMDEADHALIRHFTSIFGPLVREPFTGWIEEAARAVESEADHSAGETEPGQERPAP
ncbi:lipoyltransferase [Parvularcula bermudensis HTCC2503]|uniref:Octanoyltransferase n=1 Tax=Parvularcula bermudensis (strain ATCC BAA-594 / HTCC2503 / KCTC 12087) TaxID=314260 RepID=E0TEV3_PARBH|nr:lipoyl(octanoyl) transferase LipB [Parvularcula bermudensis]ADM09525.1 lipoyltransferase [Parvularcula bermudensis HTCC2503]